MESLLPSEIARLVLGYLEEQKCEDAAKSFLELSPHLQECRAVTSTGRRFSTKVNGFTLVDILEKFCAANAIIHERLSKVADCEQLKHCGDLLEQLRFLVDGSRGQRFVVNINVPTTSQVSGGSPIISSSMRKRHHSGGDRERSKRVQKSHHQPSGQSSEPVTSQLSCNAVETTPLEHLPGHSGSEKMEIPVEEVGEKCQEIPTTSNCSSTVPEGTGARSTIENSHASVENVESNSKPNYKTSPEKDEKKQESCSTATDTKELMQYTNSEVQTNPYDVAESETESAYEPVENLSLLTKELLNRTELQERIAENINKAILPSDSSMRDVSLNESVGGEMNTSIMTELNNAIKSVVTATESDPLFAQFLDEIIGPDAGNDESPDENNDQPVKPNDEPIKPPDSTSRDARPEAAALFDKLPTSKSPTVDVPLKNRLRSSSSHQSIRAEDDAGIAEKVVSKDDAAALEDVNAAAVLSIINAINKTEEDKSVNVLTTDNSLANTEKAIVRLEEVNEIQEVIRSNPVKTVELEKPVIVVPAPISGDAKTTKKSNIRKPRVTKPRAKIAQPSLMSEEDIMAMPTLIVCSREEMSTIINSAPIITEPVSSGGYCASKFLPIAPKMPDVTPKEEPIYLRTVTVPTRISDIPKIVGEQNIQTVKAWQEMNVAEATKLRSTENVEKIIQDVPTTEVKIPEKITLYGNETSTVTVLENSIVSTLHVDEPISVTGTGLSPFLKFNKDRPNTAEPSVTATQTHEDDASHIATTSNNDNYDHITKRTPRTLLKSRSKNNRLSMSTPRRRSSHIRALDFNTPSKGINSARRLSTNESFNYSPKSTGFEKKVCRASLFKSPPFAAAQTPAKLKSPVKDRGLCKVPIATRSPAPKLMGGWEKYTGVGMILGSTSPTSSNGSPEKTTTVNTVTSQTSVKNWDTDLRKSLVPIEETATTLRSTKKPVAKKSAQIVRHQSRKKLACSSTSNVGIDEASSETDPKKTQLDSRIVPASLPTRPVAENPNEKDQVTGRVISDELKHDTVADKVLEKSSVSDSSKNNATAAHQPKIVDTAASSKDTTVKSTKKKYATLKTITTCVTKIATEITANSIVENIGEYSCTEKNKLVQLDMLELETPRKFDGHFGIPPTPRLLSPGSSNMTTPYGQIADDATKVRGFVSTPEFPPTPSINLTPKQSSADGTEMKEEIQAGSEYYEPSSKPKDPRTIRTNDHSRHDMSLPLPGMATIAAESRVKNISSEVAHGFQASTTSNKLEITQFEVIKENLPREEAFRELKISVSTSDVEKNEDPSTRESADVSCTSHEADVPCTKDPNNTSSTLDYSSDSDTSSSSDSSTSSSSSSSSSNATNTSPNLTLDKLSPKDAASKIYSDTSNDSMQKCANIGESVDNVTREDPVENVGLINAATVVALEASRNENSPSKVFPIVKNDEELAACETETPAKDECLLPEAVIYETPSSSKAGIETTNLNSKISAFITSENRDRECEENSNAVTQKLLPKVVSVQRILPNVSIAMKPPPVSENLYNAMQGRSQTKALSDAKLSQQLEEKRLRLMAKFKEKPKPSIHRPRMKRAVVIARCKKQTNEKQEEPGETGGKEKDEITRVKETEPNLGTAESPRELEDKEPTKDQQIEGEIEAAKKHSPDEEEEKGVAKKSIDNAEKKIALNPSHKDNKEKGLSAEKNSGLEKKKVPTKKNAEEQEEESATKKSEKKRTEQTNDEISVVPSKDKPSKDEIKRLRTNDETAKREESARNNDRDKSDNAAEHKSARSRRLRSIEKARTKTECDVGKVTRNQETVHQESSDRFNVGDSRACHENPAQSAENVRKEKKESKESITVSIDTNRNATKSKVDLVKRDLFSDEESNDQRTTRSRTRQSSDFHRSDSVDSHVSPSRLSEKNNSPSCAVGIAEDMPGVLECLDLVPTVKSDTPDEADSAILDSSQSRRHHGEYHFIYDESVPTKKRKRKFSNSELEFPVEVELSDENYRKCPKLMTATSFEEIFNLTPPRKKRGTKESTLYKNKKEITTAKKAKPVFKGIQEKPLATSSPVYKTASSRTAGKTSKTPKKMENESSESKEKIPLKNDAKHQQRQHEKGNLKTRKRKGSVSKDSEQIDKKSRLTNPQLLLNKLDLDKFLTTVHGPA